MNKDFLEGVLTKAKQSGADAADVIMVRSTSLDLGIRFGSMESMELSESFDVGIRVFKGKRQAMVSTNDVSESAIDKTVERAVFMAGHIPEDQYCGLPEQEQYMQNWEETALKLDMKDKNEVNVDTLRDYIERAESTALAEKGITNSEGAGASWGNSEQQYMTSNGFYGDFSVTGGHFDVSVLAGEGTGMERDYAYTAACHLEDFEKPEDIGMQAATRALKRLNAQKLTTMQVPLVFDPRVSCSMLRHFAGAISGSSVARETSFLKNDMGNKIFGDNICIIDEPHIPRGLRSCPFDDEGINAKTLNLIENGVLQDWLLDMHTARQLGLVSNGRASRGISSPPSPKATNLYMQAGIETPEDLISGVDKGIYITELIGHGVNMVTGDYSRGAFGFWIENGEITHPVSEITIAGHLREMWKNIIPANDLKHRYGIDAPTLLIEGMTVAGS